MMKRRTLIYMVIAIVIIAAFLALPHLIRTFAWPTMVIADGSQDQSNDCAGVTAWLLPRPTALAAKFKLCCA